MASFEEHINQAKHNIEFLIFVNSTKQNNWDWQVTVCFYSAVHLINAHIANTVNGHYRSHELVDKMINPYHVLSPCKLPDDVYISYEKLSGLSRRARYLINDKLEDQSTDVHFTYDKHFAKSLRHLDLILSFFDSQYKVKLDKYPIHCIPIKASELRNFSKIG